MWSVSEFLGKKANLAAEGVQPTTLHQMEQLINTYHGLPGPRIDDRKACLRELKALAEFYRPNLNAFQQKVLDTARKLPPQSRSEVLRKQGIVLREVAMALLEQVAAELALIEASQDRWRRLRMVYVGEHWKDAEPVPGPILRMQGNFLREIYDPRHRPWGQEGQIQASWAQSASDSLYDYADSQGYVSGLTYLSPTDAQDHKISFDKGMLRLGDTPYTTSKSGAGWDIFVMDAYGSFFVGEHVEKTFHHSSLLSGSPVKGAGELMVKDGKLLKVSDRSGHYLPGPEHMYSVLWTLKEVHQVPLHGVVVEMYKRDDKGNLIVGQLGYEIGQQEAMSILNA